MFDVQMFRCSNVQMFQCSNVPMFQCSNAQMLKCSNVQISKCLDVKTFQCSNVQINVHIINIQMIQCTAVFQFSNDPVFQCSNVQMFKCSNVQMSKLLRELGPLLPLLLLPQPQPQPQPQRRVRFPSVAQQGQPGKLNAWREVPMGDRVHRIQGGRGWWGHSLIALKAAHWPIYFLTTPDIPQLVLLLLRESARAQKVLHVSFRWEVKMPHYCVVLLPA